MTSSDRLRDEHGRFVAEQRSPGTAALRTEQQARLADRLIADAQALIPESERTPAPEPEPELRPAPPARRWPTPAEQRWLAGRRRMNELLRKSGNRPLPDHPPS